MLTIKQLNYQPTSANHTLWASDLSLSFTTGKIYGLVGVNGVGKTTLLNLLSGLLNPLRGDIYWQEQAIHQSQATLRSYLAQIGYCLQDAEHLFFQQTVEEELKYHYEGDITAIVEQLKLAPLLSLSPFELSGGQKKLLALAIMLLKKPSILLGDEITAGLDAHYQQVVWDLLQAYRQQHLVILVTHNLQEAMQYCDELIFLDSQQAHAKAIADVIAQPRIFTEYGLLMPPSLEICQRLIAAKILPPGSYYRTNQEIAQAIAHLVNK